jgi:Mce-associated membrane protein
MDDSKAVPDNESSAAEDKTDAETTPPAPPRPRGKHRLPPRLAMQAAAAPASAPATEDKPAEDAAVAGPEQPADVDDAQPPQAAEAPEATETGEVAQPEGARWRKWFRRRSPKVTEPADGGADVEAATESVPEPEETPAADEPATEPAGEEDKAQAEQAADEAPVAVVEHKPAGKRLMIAAAAAAAVFVAAGAFAGAMLQPYLADRALVDTKLNIARTATSAITTLWTYTPDDMDKLADRSAKYLSGDFEAEYRKYVDAIAPVNKQGQVSNSTQVMGAAVETLEGPNATAVVYTNSTFTSPATKNIPSLRYLSYRLVMEHKDSRWLITKMTTVTSVDLTPKLGG